MDEGSLRLMCFDSEDVVLNSVVLESWYLWRGELWRGLLAFGSCSDVERRERG
jgi:hypothetical protein